MARVLSNYIEGGTDTLERVIARWAPSTENDTAAYVAAVSRTTGIDPSAKLSSYDLSGIMQAIVRHENGQQPYDADLFEKAVRLAQA